MAPDASASPAVDGEQVVLDELLATTPTHPEFLLPVLQQLQARVGFVSTHAIKSVAEAFNLSRAEVFGVVTFYRDLREAPVGDTVVQICMAEACQSVGCRELAAHACRQLGVTMNQTTADGRVHLEEAFCFGNCALGPAVRIGDDIHGGVTPERFDELLAEAVSPTV
ncbi:MAG: NAD(P)H-dependent oxidoreductase subunit E [Gemmatimonadaceae bacterium]|nr:NAD(P)H-dependent oxidoreductase subunit E [Gemmatimonadaceae bacterium]